MKQVNHYRFPDTWVNPDWSQSYGARGEITCRKRNKKRAKIARQSRRINRK